MEICLRRLTENGSFANEMLFLTQQKSYTVGRKSRNDFKLNSKNVSGTHCTFHHSPNGIFVEVLKSKKGLSVNGAEQKKGTMVFLNHNDIIQIGNEFRYQLVFKPPLDFAEPQPKNLSINNIDFNGTLPEMEGTESEVENSGSMEIQAGNVSIKSEHVEPDISASGTETMGILLPSIEIIKSEPDQNLSDSTHSVEMTNLDDFVIPAGLAINPEQNPDLTDQPMDISDIDAAMQISIDEHDTKPLFLPVLNPENSTSTSNTLTENQSSFANSIKQENSPNELATHNPNSESDLNQNILENGIKIENPDIPSTNLTLFAKDTPEIQENFPPENRIPETLPIENLLPVNENLELPVNEGMQIEFEELDLKSFSVPETNSAESILSSELPVNLENRINSEKSDFVLNKPLIRIRSDLGFNSFVEPSIENQFPLIESGIDSLIPNQNGLGIRVKEERIDSPTENRNETDQNSERIDSPMENPNVDQSLGFRIKEERVDPPLDFPNQEIAENSEVRVKAERTDPKSPEVEFVEERRKRRRRDSNEGFLGVRIKQEKIDSPELIEHQLDPFNFVQEVKRERRDSPVPNPSIQSQTSEDPFNQNLERIKEEPGLNTPLNFDQEVKRERRDSPGPGPSIPSQTTEDPFNQNLERVKEEPGLEPSQNEPIEMQISNPIDYSQIVSDDMEFLDEKPLPSAYENLNNLAISYESPDSSDLDVSDCSTDSYNEGLPSNSKRKKVYRNADMVVKEEIEDNEVPEFKSIRDIKNLTVAELEEYKRNLEILDSNNDPDEIAKLFSRNFEESSRKRDSMKKLQESKRKSVERKRDYKEKRSDRNRKTDRRKRDSERESENDRERETERKIRDSTKEFDSIDRRDSRSERDSRKEKLTARDRKGRKVEERESKRDSDSKRSRFRRDSDSRRQSPERESSKESPKRNERDQFSRSSESSRTGENLHQDNQEARNHPEPFEPPRITSTEDPRNKESEVANKDLRTNSTERNYPGARVLDDYELPEERGRSDARDRVKKGGEKVKLDYKEYMRRRAERGPQSKDQGPRRVDNNVVPISTFRGPRMPDHLVTEGWRDPRIIPGVGNSGVSNLVFNDLRTQPQGPQADPRLWQRGIDINNPTQFLGQGPQPDPRFMQWGIDSSVPNTFVDPRLQGRPQVSVSDHLRDSRSVPYFQNPTSSYMDPAIQGRVESSVPIGTPRDPRLIYGGMENSGVLNFVEGRIQGRVQSQSPIEGLPRDPRGLRSSVDSQSPSSSNGLSRDQIGKSRGVENSKIQITAIKDLRLKEAQGSASGELVINPRCKVRMVNGKDGKHRKDRKDRKDGKDGRSYDQLKKKASHLKLVEKPKTLVSTVPYESEELTDELLVTIFSWDPAPFENADPREETPYPALKNVRHTALSYANYAVYCDTVFSILILDVSIQIQEAFKYGGEKPLLDKCIVLPDIVPKVRVNGQDLFIVPFHLKISVWTLKDSAPPAVGDLLRISVLDEKAKKSVIFGYIKKIESEEPIDSSRKLVTYLVSIKQQTFNIYKSVIQNVKQIVNLNPAMEKARAIHLLRKSPLLNCILRPNPEIDPSVPETLLNKDNLIYKRTIDKKQLTVVSKTLKSFWNEKPDVCVVEGTAGTGKTNIIVNTILQLLCTKQPKMENDHLRILVCASTNTEIDEIIMRINNVIELAKIGNNVIKMVVVGPDDGRRERTKDLSLSNFARTHVETDMHKYQEAMHLKSFEDQSECIKREMKRLTDKFESTKCVHVALQMSLLKTYYQIGQSGRKLQKITPAEKRELLSTAEFTFLAGANLIFSSVQNLNCTVMEKFRETHTIPVCFVEDSASIVEMDALKVLSFGARTLVLLGDKYRYPNENYDILYQKGWGHSLFHRILQNYRHCQRTPVVKLITQYRITGRIEQWMLQSRLFGMGSTIRNLVEERIAFPLHPLRIFNLQHTEDFVDNEAVFASRVIHCIANFGDLRRMERNISVGVIISDIDAKERVEQEIENKLEDTMPGKKQIFSIEVDTIDGFLNHEKDIILASCIRNKHLTSNAGFQRFHQTLTRVKHCLIIYGRFARLGKYKGNCDWHKLVDYARNIVNVSVYGESTELRRDLIK